MPRYSDTLRVRFNIIEDGRWQILDKMPSVLEIIDSGQIEKRDAWVFFVREKEGELAPYYFDSIRREIFPFNPDLVLRRHCHSQLIGDGKNREIVVEHGLDSWDVTGTVWESVGDRLYQVQCDVFKIRGSLNHLGFSFSEPPRVDQFEVEIVSGDVRFV